MYVYVIRILYLAHRVQKEAPVGFRGRHDTLQRALDGTPPRPLSLPEIENGRPLGV